MKTKSLVFVSISVVATVLGSIAARDAAADNKPFTPVNVSPVGVKPQLVPLKIPVADLGPKKVTLFNKALTKNGLPQLTMQPPPAFIRLTPAVPADARGSRITKVGVSVYSAPDATSPDGAFLIAEAQPNVPNYFSGFGGLSNLPQFPGPNGSIEMMFMSEATKQYVADCRFTSMDGLFPDQPRVINFAHSTSTTQHALTQDDGHYLYAFRAEQTAQITMTATIPNGSAAQYFFGCEISKL
jgi:hypothetical protein